MKQYRFLVYIALFCVVLGAGSIFAMDEQRSREIVRKKVVDCACEGLGQVVTGSRDADIEAVCVKIEQELQDGGSDLNVCIATTVLCVQRECPNIGPYMLFRDLPKVIIRLRAERILRHRRNKQQSEQAARIMGRVGCYSRYPGRTSCIFRVPM